MSLGSFQLCIGVAVGPSVHFMMGEGLQRPRGEPFILVVQGVEIHIVHGKFTPHDQLLKEDRYILKIIGAYLMVNIHGADLSKVKIGAQAGRPLQRGIVTLCCIPIQML
ncbi:hypothetical protein SDC9_141955 [bioreactor metagenome]|uniref:Uncharacterized protein n=1 Tax=bioreactor metagenome TaxID=1076179 RepID=A0A645DZJ8_9ZZZZ